MPIGCRNCTGRVGKDFPYLIFGRYTHPLACPSSGAAAWQLMP